MQKMAILVVSVVVMLWASLAAGMERVQLSATGKSFVLADSKAPFVPWGLNYGCTHKLIEEYWEDDWKTVTTDFADMKRMGANVVRIHLQVGHFMESADKPNEKSLKQLERLTQLAEETGLYLDLTGLSCYRTADNPKWYDDLEEKPRWAVQARFWDAVAARCEKSPAIFCYDLMNEPIVAGGKRKPGEWLSGKPLGGLDFVQFISIDQGDRKRDQIAREWIIALREAIRGRDKRHLITVGMLPWVPGWGHLSGFIPETVAPELDFLSVHIYPESPHPADAMKALKLVATGKPVVIEETFPLSCNAAELKIFLLESRALASGWMGHYAGETPEILRTMKKAWKITVPQSLMLDWLDVFREMKAEMKAKP